jgi:hypothetical protein
MEIEESQPAVKILVKQNPASEAPRFAVQAV